MSDARRERVIDFAYGNAVFENPRITRDMVVRAYDRLHSIHQEPIAMASVYAAAPEVAEVANRLIRQFHPHLAEEGVRVEYLFVDPPPESRGKTVLGRCRKISGLNAFLAAIRPEIDDEGDEPIEDQTPFFVVEIAQQAWHLMDDAAREALVDHELCHAGVTRGEHGELKLSIIPHDVEEFACIVERHGLWESQVRDFVEAALANREVPA